MNPADVRAGITLGVRLALFAQAVIITAVVWCVVIEGRSSWIEVGLMPASERVVLAFAFGPWIVVFVLQLFGWWRTALGFAVISDLSVVALLLPTDFVSAFRSTGGFTTAVVIALGGTVFVALGLWASAESVRHPWFGLLAGGVGAGVYTVYTNWGSRIPYEPTPLVMGGLAFLLAAIGMAFAGKPRTDRVCGPRLSGDAERDRRGQGARPSRSLGSVHKPNLARSRGGRIHRRRRHRRPERHTTIRPGRTLSAP